MESVLEYELKKILGIGPAEDIHDIAVSQKPSGEKIVIVLLTHQGTRTRRVVYNVQAEKEE